MVVNLNVFRLRFSIDKLDSTDEYEVDLVFTLRIDDVTTDFPVMADKRIPIPICNRNFSLALPGDGTVKGFFKELGDNVGQAAIDLVLKELNLQVLRLKQKHMYIIYTIKHFSLED